MNAVQIVGLLLRSGSLWLALAALQMIAIAWMWPSTSNPGATVSAAMPTITLVVAAVGWVGARWLARLFLIESSSTTAALETISKAEVGGRLTCFAIGLGLACFKGLTQSFQYLALLYIVSASGQQSRLSQPALHVDGFVALTALIAGLALMFGARRLARRFVA